MKFNSHTCPVCGLPRGKGHPACSRITQAQHQSKLRKARKVDPSYTRFNPSN